MLRPAVRGGRFAFDSASSSLHRRHHFFRIVIVSITDHILLPTSPDPPLPIRLHRPNRSRALDHAPARPRHRDAVVGNRPGAGGPTQPRRVAACKLRAEHGGRPVGTNCFISKGGSGGRQRRRGGRRGGAGGRGYRPGRVGEGEGTDAVDTKDVSFPLPFLNPYFASLLLLMMYYSQNLPLIIKC